MSADYDIIFEGCLFPTGALFFFAGQNSQQLQKISVYREENIERRRHKTSLNKKNKKVEK